MKWLPSCLLLSTVSGGVNIDPPYCPPCPVTMVCVPCVPVLPIPVHGVPHSHFTNAASALPPPEPIMYSSGPLAFPSNPILPGRRVVLPPAKTECHDYLCKAILRNRKQYTRYDDYRIPVPIGEPHYTSTKKVTRKRCRLIHECEEIEVTKYRN